MPYKDPEAMKAYQRAWCKRKRKDGTLKLTKKKKKIKMILAAKDVPCDVCQQRFDPCCMDFHHRNPAEKKYEIADYNKFGLKYLQEELDKCIPLCACCHRKVHAGLVSLTGA